MQFIFEYSNNHVKRFAVTKTTGPLTAKPRTFR